METFNIIFVSNVFIVYFCTMNEELFNILQKVRCLYMKYGIKSVTMDDIARELGISKKTLYQYVNDKNELVAKVVDMEISEKNKLLCATENTNLNAIEDIFEVHRMVQQMIKDYNPATEYDLRKYYPELYAQINKVRRERIYKNVIENLKKGKSEGLYRTDFDEELIAKVQLSRIEATFDDKVFTHDELLSPRLFKEIFIYHIRGIANEKGLAVLEEKLKNLDNNNKNE
jgi:TetR/AcrR family transcriptional regulator, cholesterol catabolism regulator